MIVAFTPVYNQVFQFQATLDSSSYSVQVTWSLYRQDYMVNIYSLTGVHIFTMPLIGSPPDYDINLLPASFTTSTLVYRQAASQFEINP